MVHTIHYWIYAYQTDANYILLQKDIRNTFNEVLPHEFLKDAQEYAPASARFAIRDSAGIILDRKYGLYMDPSKCTL